MYFICLTINKRTKEPIVNKFSHTKSQHLSIQTWRQQKTRNKTVQICIIGVQDRGQAYPLGLPIVTVGRMSVMSKMAIFQETKKKKNYVY